MHRLSHIPQKIPVREPALLLTLYLSIRGFNNLSAQCSMHADPAGACIGTRYSSVRGCGIQPETLSLLMSSGGCLPGPEVCELSPDNYHIRDNKQHLLKVLSMELSVRDRTQRFQFSSFAYQLFNKCEVDRPWYKHGRYTSITGSLARSHLQRGKGCVTS